MRPLIVVHGESRALAELLTQLGADYALVSGWTLPARPWSVAGVVCVGAVRDADDAQAALLAAARGAGVVALAHCTADELDAFVDDLARLGPVDERNVHDRTVESEERRLLELLAAGKSIDEAAAALHVSRRTAERRLASARRAFGVRTTAAAIAAVSRS